MSRHGGNLRELREKAGREVIDFSASINPYGAPEWLREEIFCNLEGCEHYPDPQCVKLIRAAAEAFGVEAQKIAACNGISEALAFLPHTADYKRALIPEPGYSDYAPYCRNTGLQVEYYPLDKANCFAYPPVDELARLARSEDLIVICTPNNPAGSAVDVAYIVQLAQMCPESTVVVDAAYYDFLHDGVGHPQGGREWLATLPDNVVVLWSMTKFYSIAGLRLGLVIARKSIISRLIDLLPSWNVNNLSQSIGARALQDSGFYKESRVLSAQLYKELYDGLKSFACLKICPSKCNFILCRIDNEVVNAGDLAAAMLSHGVAIRDGANIKGLDPFWFRVAVRNREENKQLLCALEKELPGRLL